MFADRQQAGVMLADALQEYKDDAAAAVVAIPRGGVVVGGCIARLLRLPLAIVTVKKLTLPNNPELALGAVGNGNVQILDAVSAYHLTESEVLLDAQEKIQKEIVRRKHLYQEDRYKHIIQGKRLLILVDDGVATGATVRVAAKVLKKRSRKNTSMILAVPVVAKSVWNELQSVFARIIALEVSAEFHSVGQFYQSFPQVSDEEVLYLINQSTNKPIIQSSNKKILS